MGCGDQGQQHQARVTPSQSMTIRRLLHVRFGSMVLIKSRMRWTKPFN